MVSVGYHFLPTDQECINLFLRRKVNGEVLESFYPIIDGNVPIFNTESLPWDVFQDNNPYWLYDNPGSENSKKVIYAFTRLVPFGTGTTTTRKRRCHAKRTAGGGTWCRQQSPKPISQGGQTIGYRTSFTFKIKKNDTFNNGRWILHEFSMDDTDWVLCKITVDSSSLAKRQKISSATTSVAGSEQPTSVAGSEQPTRKRKMNEVSAEQENYNQQLVSMPPLLDLSQQQFMPPNPADTITDNNDLYQTTFSDVFQNQIQDYEQMFPMPPLLDLSQQQFMPPNPADTVRDNNGLHQNTFSDVFQNQIQDYEQMFPMPPPLDSMPLTIPDDRFERDAMPNLSMDNMPILEDWNEDELVDLDSLLEDLC